MTKDTTAKPDEALLWTKLGYAQAGLKKYDDAITSYKKAVDLETASKKPRMEIVGLAQAGLGEVYARTGKVDDANTAYDAAAKADPTRAGLYLKNEAIIFFQQGNGAAQGQAADRAIAVDPNDPILYYLKGNALVQNATVDPKTHEIVLPPGCTACLPEVPASSLPMGLSPLKLPAFCSQPARRSIPHTRPASTDPGFKHALKAPGKSGAFAFWPLNLIRPSPDGTPTTGLRRGSTIQSMSPELLSYEEAACLVAAQAARLAPLRPHRARSFGTSARPRARRGRFLPTATSLRFRDPHAMDLPAVPKKLHAMSRWPSPALPRAGDPPAGPLPPGSAWEIMTGAPVPDGADAVMMIEHVETSHPERVRLLPPRTISAGENIVKQGAQARAGEELLAPGTVIDAGADRARSLLRLCKARCIRTPARRHPRNGRRACPGRGRAGPRPDSQLQRPHARGAG